MQELLSLQLKLVPDLLDVMQKRLDILRHVYLQQPIGRRSLAQSLDITERVLRAEVDFLRDQGLIYVENIGMSLTSLGIEVMESLDHLIKEVYGLSSLEQRLQPLLRVKRVFVVPGNSDESDLNKRELGRKAAQYLLSVLTQHDIVAVTGGSTLASMAEMVSGSQNLPNVLFVPARGGLGEHVETQANHIAATCAKKVGAKYRLFHVSDYMGAQAFRLMINDPYIVEMLDLVRSSTVVVHGMGRAIEMAVRRNASGDVLRMLEQGRAVGEAFGNYFDSNGTLVYQTETMGLRLEDIQKARCVIGIAGGKRKAEAIYAVSRAGYQDVLIIDEAAAEGIIEYVQ